MNRTKVAGMRALCFCVMSIVVAVAPPASAADDSSLPAGPAQSAAGPRDALEHAYQSGMTVERVRAFAEDPLREVMINWGAGPKPRRDVDPETYIAQNDNGTTGIFTAIEPADSALYRERLPKPLRMPGRPAVAFVVVDYNRGNPITRYYEAMVMLKGLTPQGEETWWVVSMPVESRLMLDVGVAWGFPKFIADTITLDERHAVVTDEGKVKMSLEFTPSIWAEDELQTMPAVDAFGINDMMVFHPTSRGPVAMRFAYGPISIQRWTEGKVKITVDPDDWWADLIPPGATAAGVHQRYVSLGDSIIRKIKD